MKTVDQKVQMTKLPDKVVVLRVQFHRFGVQLQIKGDRKDKTLRTKADKTRIHLQKNLLDGPELKAIRNLATVVDQYLEWKCIPFGGFGAGGRLLNRAILQEVDTRLTSYLQEHNKRAEAFIKAYPALKEQAKKTLWELYSEEDYPAPEQVRAKFSMTGNYFSLSVPGGLSDLKQEIANKEAAKFQQLWDQTQQECMAVLRSQFKALVDHAADRLATDRQTGKHKKFHDTAITNITQFLETFQHRDLADDRELQGIIKQARKLVDGVNGAILRTDDGLRTELAKKFSQMAKHMDKMVQELPDRLIDFDD